MAELEEFLQEADALNERRRFQAARVYSALSSWDLPNIAVCWSDGDLVLELIWDNRRLGFSIETDPKESGWFYVTKPPDKSNGSGTLDYLTDTDLHYIVKQAIEVPLENVEPQDVLELAERICAEKDESLADYYKDPSEVSSSPLGYPSKIAAVAPLVAQALITEVKRHRKLIADLEDELSAVTEIVQNAKDRRFS